VYGGVSFASAVFFWAVLRFLALSLMLQAGTQLELEDEPGLTPRQGGA
jgi:hypothetical protein